MDSKLPLSYRFILSILKLIKIYFIFILCVSSIIMDIQQTVKNEILQKENDDLQKQLRQYKKIITDLVEQPNWDNELREEVLKKLIVVTTPKI